MPAPSIARIRLARKASGNELPDSSGSPHLSDIKGLEVVRAAVGKFVMGHRWPRNGSGGLAGIAASPCNSAIVISQDLGVEEYFNAMAGQVPEPD
jgi:hypothetical protein